MELTAVNAAHLGGNAWVYPVGRIGKYEYADIAGGYQLALVNTGMYAFVYPFRDAGDGQPLAVSTQTLLSTAAKQLVDMLGP